MDVECPYLYSVSVACSPVRGGKVEFFESENQRLVVICTVQTTMIDSCYIYVYTLLCLAIRDLSDRQERMKEEKKRQKEKGRKNNELDDVHGVFFFFSNVHTPFYDGEIRRATQAIA